MTVEKMGLACQAAIAAIFRLQPSDQFAVVTFDDQSEVVVPATLATPAAQQQAANRIRRIYPGHETNLFLGWRDTCKQLAPILAERAVGRVILVTDGLANCGITDHAEIAHQVERQRQDRIVTSTIGVGPDFDETLLGQLADAGGGNFYYVEHNQQLLTTVDNEVGEALCVIAEATQLIIAAPAGAEVTSLNNYPLHPDPATGHLVLRLGDLIARQQLSLVLKVTLPAAPIGKQCSMQLWLAAEDSLRIPAPAVVEWTGASEAQNNAQGRNLQVTRAAAKLFVAQARQRAVELNRQGRYQAAEQHLLRIARNNRRVADNDPVQLALCAELEQQALRVRNGLDDRESKTMFSMGYSTLRERDEFGRALRDVMAEE